MAFSHGVVVSLYFVAIMFVVLFFDDGEHQVKGSEIFLANVGENITLNCSTGRSDDIIYWYRNKEGHKSTEYIAAVEPLRNQSYLYDDVDNNHFSQQHEVNSSEYRSFTLGVYDVNINDSANYTCNFNRSSSRTYDVRIMECTDCQSNLFRPSNPNRKIVDCVLNNFHGPHLQHKVNIIVNNNKNKTASIEKNTLSFTISNARLYNSIIIEFNPHPEKNNLGSNITCIIPPQPSTHPTSTASTMVITTNPWTSTKSSSVSTHPSPSPTFTSSVITATEYDQESTSAIKRSFPSATSNATFFSTPTKPSQKNTDSSSLMSTSSVLPKMSPTYEQSVEDNNSDNATVIIITTAGSFVLVVLIVIFLILRRKQAKRCHQRKSYHIDTNKPSADKAAPGERDYELIGDVSQTQPCELVDNILYESSDGVIEGLASTSDDKLDTVLYTLPDKTGIIKRVAVSKKIRGPSDLMNPHGNNAMIRHYEATESKQGQENQYEDVAMTCKGSDDDIPLYAMPNKGPRSVKNNPKCRPGSESIGDSALFHAR